MKSPLLISVSSNNINTLKSSFIAVKPKVNQRKYWNFFLRRQVTF